MPQKIRLVIFVDLSLSPQLALILLLASVMLPSPPLHSSISYSLFEQSIHSKSNLQ